MSEITKYGITLRFIEIADAEFVVNLRNDASKGRFISATSTDVSVQENWISNYKERELDKKEYYFIAVDSEGTMFSTYRVYDITVDSVEIGSWVSKPGYSVGMNSIKVDLIVKEFVFDNLGFDILRFTVNKGNSSVLKYHKLFKPTIVSVDDENFYYHLNKDDYYQQRNIFFKNIK